MKTKLLFLIAILFTVNSVNARDRGICQDLHIANVNSWSTQTISGTTVFISGCNLIVTIAPSGANPVGADVSAEVNLDDTVHSYHGQPYVQRNYYLELPDGDMDITTGDITFYFTQAEFDAFNVKAAALGYPLLPTGPTDATGISHLMITHYKNYLLPQYAPGDFPAGGVLEDPVDGNITWDPTNLYWKVRMPTDVGFGGFFVHTNLGVGPLAIKDLAFTGSHTQGVNQLQWSSKTEESIASYELQRSDDGKVFNAVNQVQAGAGNYTYNDVLSTNAALVYYYRLRITGNNGQYTYSTVVSLTSNSKENTVSATPNPFINILGINITAAETSTLNIQLTDLSGRVILQQTSDVNAGSNVLTINGTSGLATGMYQLTVKGNNFDKTIRVVKQ